MSEKIEQENSIETSPELEIAPTEQEIKSVVNTQELHRVNLKNFMLGCKGKFLGIDFIKLDGLERTIVGRLGVRAHLKGGKNNVEADDRPYLVMYDMQSRGYRTVNLSTTLRIRVNGMVYDIVD